MNHDDVRRWLVCDIAPSNNTSINSVSVFVVAWIYENASKHVMVKEPEKCHGWMWISDSCPEPIFPPLKYVLEDKREHLGRLVLQTTQT